MKLSLVLAVAVGGFVGAPSRYLLDRVVSRRMGSKLPWGTLAVNVTGSLLLGLLSGLSLAHHLSAVDDGLLGIGFCGAYTTYSTFSFETVRLFEEGLVLNAMANLVASLAAGLACAGAGVAIGLAL